VTLILDFLIKEDYIACRLISYLHFNWNFMEKEINVGVVVRLKSGSPAMVVQSIFDDANGQKSARCAWFEDTKPMTEKFVVASLMTEKEWNNS
jgi:uncharacterized protein YodC (DUF2158 family)